MPFVKDKIVHKFTVVRPSLIISLLVFPVLCSSQVQKTAHVPIVINDYTAVTSLDVCTNKITVKDVSDFFVGDTVFLIQMQGAVLDSSNSTTFGAVTDYKNCGNYEFNYIKNISGNTVELSNRLTRQYDVPYGKVQLIRVPYFNYYYTADPIECPYWNGETGGVVVLTVKETLELGLSIDASDVGFRGGVNHNIQANTMACAQDRYYYDSASWQNGRKGEGI